MINLFTENISSWNDWSKVYQSIPAFKDIVEAVFLHEKLPFTRGSIANLSPGTNAVFRVNDYVIKLFTPVESGQDGSVDCAIELATMQFAEKLDISSPKVVASGEICDKYRFSYIIMEYLDAVEAYKVLPGFSDNEAANFAKEMREISDRLHQPTNIIPAVDHLKRVRTNHRLDGLPASLKQDIISSATSTDYSYSILVHGDLTSENVLVDKSKRPIIIDFADCCIAPDFYELPPIILDLFKLDKRYVDSFFDKLELDGFIDKLVKGVAIHDFGADIIRVFCDMFGEQNNFSLSDIHTLEDFSNAISKVYYGL